jgi:transketolase
MRKQFSDVMVARSASSRLVFMTCDLGFMALEPLQAALGEYFINAGVAEQNMVSVAAAMARQGIETWVYNIAPFCYARPFEQIRNDIAFHGLPVKLVGNGGGFGYGVQGPTHHGIEDYGVLLALPNMSAYVPVFDEDLAAVIPRMGQEAGPAYLRLGRGEPPKGWTVPEYAPWRQLLSGGGKTVISVGPLAGSYIAALQELPDAVRPNLWAVAELPLEKHPLPAALMAQIASGAGLCVAEEHVARGGFGAELALYLAEREVSTGSFTHLCARNHLFDTYGSQDFLRRRSGIATENLLAWVGASS